MQEYISIKQDILSKLEENLPELRERFGIETIGIFGSVARGEDTLISDVDILYRFQKGRGRLREFIGLAEYLENLFCRKVELISIDYIDPYIKPYVKMDAIVYGNSPAIA